MRVRRASVSVGLGLSLMAGVLTTVVVSATPAQASRTPLPTLATAQPIGFNDRVSAAARSEDTLYLGGDFTQAGRTTGAGAFANTQQQGHQAIRAGSPQFARGTQDASVFASVYVDNYAGDGFFGWFVGGNFTSVGGQPRTNFAAIDFNSGGQVGAVVAEWAPSFNGSVNALAVKPASGGRNAVLYVGGNFTSVTIDGTTSTRTHIAAFDITTKALLDWAPAISQDVKAIAVSGDRVYVGGGFSAVTPVGGASTPRGKVAAFAADDTGTLLPWAPAVGNWNVWTLAVKDDTVFVGGDFTEVTPDGGSTPLTRSKMAAIAGDDTGTVLPWAPQFAGGDVHTISVVDSAGFAGGRPALIIGGGFTGVTPVGGGTATTRDRIAAVGVDDTGTLLPWAPSFDASVLTTSVSRQFHACPDGGSCVYVGGNFAQAGSVVGNANQARARIAVISLDDTGTLRSWSPGVSGVGGTTRVRTVSAAPLHGNSDKTVFLGGEFTLAGMTPRSRLAALDAQGELTPWAPSVGGGVAGGVGGTVRALTTGGGQVYVGGTFTTAAGNDGQSSSRRCAASFDTSGVLSSWNPISAGSCVQLDALAYSGGRVYVGGNFYIGAFTAVNLTAFAGTGTGALSTWIPRPGQAITSMALAGDRLYVSGPTLSSFTQNGQVVTRNRVASIFLDDSGTLSTWNPNVTGGAVNSISVSGPKAYISGAFTTVGGQSRPRLAAVSTEDTGSLLALNVSPSNTVNGAAYAGDRLVIGGAFTQVGGQARRLAATIDDSGAGSVNAAIESYNAIEMVAVTGGQVVLGGYYNASLGGVSIGNVAYGPSAPTAVTASAYQYGNPYDGELALTWSAPWSGTFPIQGYGIEMSSDGGATWSTVVANTGNTGTNRMVQGLTNGTTYSFKVTALTALGGATSEASTPVAPVVPSTAPTFTPETPPTTGTVGTAYSSYTFTASGTTPIAFTKATGDLPPGLTLSTGGVLSGIPTTAGSYTFTVQAANGTTPNATTSSITIVISAAPTPTPTPTPGDPPSAPREVSAVAGDASAEVRWSTPSSPGSFPVSSYQVTASPGGRGCMTTALTCTVSNLVNGTTYTFTVKALNGVGWGAASAPSDPATPRATPKPTITIMITGTRSARTIEIAGSTRGIEPGSQITPWIRKHGAAQAQAGRPQAIDDQGEFTWSRRVRSDGTLRAYVTWGDIESNVVRLPAGRTR
jgi:trimeric autotransporter adhesin